MARTKFKWKIAIFSYLILVNVFTKSLPIEDRLLSLKTTDTVFKAADIPAIENIVDNRAAIPLTNEPSIELKHNINPKPNDNNTTEKIDGNNTDVILNMTKNMFREDVRPGQRINDYDLEITPNGNSFSARAVIEVELTFATREDNIVLHFDDSLSLESVMVGVFSVVDVIEAAGTNHDGGRLEIDPVQTASSFFLIITYTGSLTTAGQGLYRGSFNDFNYLAMNLHPSNARRVFPCMDEPTRAAAISFTFNNIEYNNIVSNSELQENSQTTFKALNGPPHLWTMAAHNFNNINVPTSNVLLYIRPGVSNQESQASVAFNFYFNTLNEWTNKAYFDIQLDQNPQLSILALPDVSVDWYGLSLIGLWEPYVLMEISCSAKQRYTGLVKMAEAMSRQWFGYVIYPENWRHEWVVSGMASYAAWDVFKEFQSDTGTGVISTTLLDVNTLFVTDVIQESLLRDSYTNVQILDPGQDLFEENEIRNNNNGILKYKAPALMRMLRLVLGDESQDFIKRASSLLVTARTLQTVSSTLFIDAINGAWSHHGNGQVDNIEEFLNPWIQAEGYPLIDVRLLQGGAGGVLVTQERFGFSSPSHEDYNVPITYSVSSQPNYDAIHPIDMMTRTTTYPMFLDEEEGDYVLFNIQGQGYYRVNYDEELTERIIGALDDPDRRAEIHPLNRATLIDDYLNLARGGRIDYDWAFQMVLTMEHETEYAPWKAFIRNMDFLRKRLVAMVQDDEELDPDIYLRMVRRSIIAFEREIGFTPDTSLSEPVMVSLTRGLVMDHACRSNYQPCIAAAVDWFWDPNNNDVVNPNIPADLRPAVYCTMVKEGGNEIITALQQRLEIEPSMYERVVILESLGCSQDENYVRNLLEETIATNSPYTAEEGLSIFKAVAAASYTNAQLALNFINMRTYEVKDMYGGVTKFEDALVALGENMAGPGLSHDLNVWVNSQNNRLDDSQFQAERIVARVMEDLDWQNAHMEYVYQWIDENDAPALIVSSVLLFVSCMIALFNQ